MQRPTLIARGSTPLVQAQYTKVQVDPDAYGIGKGVGALAEGLQSAAGSAFKYAQVKEQKAEEAGQKAELLKAQSNRNDAQKAALRSIRRKQLDTDLSTRYSEQLGDTTSEAFKAQQEGRSAAYAAKFYREGLSAVDKEYPLDSIASPEMKQSVLMQEDTDYTEKILSLTNSDNTRKATLRQMTVEDSITHAFKSARNRTPGPQNVFSTLTEVRKGFEGAVGIDRKRADAFASNLAVEELRLAAATNRNFFTFKTQAEADKNKKLAFENGLGPEGASMFDLFSPANADVLIREGEAFARTANTQEGKDTSLNLLSNALEIKVSDSQMSPMEALTKKVEYEVSIKGVDRAVATLTLQEYEVYEKLYDEGGITTNELSSFFKSPSDEVGKFSPVADTETNRKSFGLAMSRSKDLFEKSRQDFQGYAEDVSPAVRAAGEKVTAAIVSGADMKEVAELNKIYNVALQQAHVEKGTDRQHDMKTSSKTFVPRSAIPAFSKQISQAIKRGDTSSGSLVLDMRDTYGAEFTNAVGTTLIKSEDPVESARGLAFLLAVHSGSPPRAARVFADLEQLLVRSGELKKIQEEARKDNRIMQTLSKAKLYGQTDGLFNLSGWRAFVANKESSDVSFDRTQTVEAAALALGSMVPGDARDAVLKVFDDIILSAGNQSFVSRDEGMARAANGIMRMVNNAGLTVVVNSAGLTIPMPNYVATTPKLIGRNSEPVAASMNDVAKSYNAGEKALLFNMQQESFKQSGAMAAYLGRGFSWTLDRQLFNPFGRDIKDSLNMGEHLTNWVLGSDWKDRLPKDVMNLGNPSFVPSPDGEVMFLVFPQSTVSGALMRGFDKNLGYVRDNVTGRPFEVPMDRYAAFAASANMRDATGFLIGEGFGKGGNLQLGVSAGFVTKADIASTDAWRKSEKGRLAFEGKDRDRRITSNRRYEEQAEIFALDRILAEMNYARQNR